MWFVVGSVVFQIRGIKSFFTTSSSLFSALSLFLLTYSPSPIIVFMNSIELHLISELYLIGANISGYEQFGKMSPRIIIYILLFSMLWMVLESLV